MTLDSLRRRCKPIPPPTHGSEGRPNPGLAPRASALFPGFVPRSSNALQISQCNREPPVVRLGTEHPCRRHRDANPVQNRGAHAFQRASAHGRRPRAARRNDFPPVSRFGGFTDNVGYCLRIDSFVGDPDCARILISQRPPLGRALGTPQNACMRFAGVCKSLAFLEVDGKQPFSSAIVGFDSATPAAYPEHDHALPNTGMTAGMRRTPSGFVVPSRSLCHFGRRREGGFQPRRADSCVRA